MAVFKCKMCGANLEITPDMRVGTCGHCGSTMTLPHLDSGKKENLYDRANHLRRIGEFDKAAGIYELILNEDANDAEAYWSLVLCRYGVEYVQDPDTQKRVPTCHRTLRAPIFADENYKMALSHAAPEARRVYEAEAEAIDGIQKGILSISEKAEHFDVFICYKETGRDGKRTPDSVLAQELYHELAELGYKVFFAKITLENKLGAEYEPYIFAALNSARAMVVVGTKAEHLNAPWVKNEWSRYLALINAGQPKVLIPAYRDMDPYDLPEEFSHLQAQDMAKLGFMQDLVRGIRKILEDTGAPSEGVQEVADAQVDNAPSTKSLMARAFLFLEDQNFAKAEEYFERVLDAEPHAAKAYMGKVLVKLQLSCETDLGDFDIVPLEDVDDFQKALRFADEEYGGALLAYSKAVQENVARRKREEAYRQALKQADECRSEVQHTAMAKVFRDMGEYKDAPALARRQAELAREAKRDAEKLREARELQELEEEKKRKKGIICLAAVSIALAFILPLVNILPLFFSYHRATGYIERGQYEEAIPILQGLGDYKDSSGLIPDAQYHLALQKMDSGQYKEAISLLQELGSYKDSKEHLQQAHYQYGVELMGQKEYRRSIQHLENSNGYLDSQTRIDTCYLFLLSAAAAGNMVRFGRFEQDNHADNGAEPIEWRVLKVEDEKALLITTQVIFCHRMNYDTYTSVSDTYVASWWSCSVREWLNQDFFSTAFSASQQGLVPDAGEEANPDKVFILNAEEARDYFPTAEARKSSWTPYAVASMDYTLSAYKGSWWLRDTGSTHWGPGFYIVSSTGSITTKTVRDICGVRPVLWVDLAKAEDLARQTATV